MKDLIPIIIINYQHPANTLECLESIRSEDDIDQLKPVVVDASPNQDLKNQLSSKFDDWVDYLPLEKNLGFSGANNVGIHYSLEKYQPKTVILLNDDTKIGAKALTNLHQKLNQDQKTAALAPKIYFYPGEEYQTGYQTDELGKVIWYAGGEIDWTEVLGFHRGIDEVDRGQFDNAMPTKFATGCCLALNTSALQEVGVFNDDYFLYLEDLDLSIRFQQAGWKTGYEPSSVIWHKNAGSSGAGSKLHQYYQTRNRFLFGFKYAPWRTKLFLLKHLLIQYRHGTGTTRQAIQDFILERYGQRIDIH